MVRIFLAASTLAAAAAWPVTAHHDGDTAVLGNISISHAWTAETASMAHAVEVYVTVENTGREPVTLTGAGVDFAAPGVFQAPAVRSDGTMSTSDISAVEVGAGQTITMQPGGLHIVFNDVQDILSAGKHFHARLEFAEAGEVEIEVLVEPSSVIEQDANDLG